MRGEVWLRRQRGAGAGFVGGRAGVTACGVRYSCGNRRENEPGFWRDSLEVTVCAVSYGYGNRAEMEPDFWIDDLCELLD